MLLDNLNVDCSNCVACNHKHPLFGLLTEEELTRVNVKRFEVNFAAGEMLFKQGSPATHLVCVTSGLVKIYIEGPSGKNLILKLATPTELFGGPGTFIDSRHHYSAIAVERTSACFIEQEAFHELLRTNMKFNEAFIIGISRKSMSIHDRFYDMSYKQMHGKVADALIYLCKEVYKANPFKISVTRVDIAELTALSRESVIRILKEFKEEGIFKHDVDDMVTLNIPALERISQFN